MSWSQLKPAVLNLQAPLCAMTLQGVFSPTLSYGLPYPIVYLGQTEGAASHTPINRLYWLSPTGPVLSTSATQIMTTACLLCFAFPPTSERKAPTSDVTRILLGNPTPWREAEGRAAFGSKPLWFRYEDRSKCLVMYCTFVFSLTILSNNGSFSRESYLREIETSSHNFARP